MAAATQSSTPRSSYFAYGSNMAEAQMVERDVPHTNPRPAVLIGYRLAFNKSAGDGTTGYANVMREPTQKVEGVLYDVNEAGLSNLDRFEGARQSPSHYDRCDVDVFEQGKQTPTKAVAYIANPLMVASGLKPTAAYLARLLAGRKFLSAEYAAELAKTPTC